MALVSYDYDSDSENEFEEDEKVDISISQKYSEKKVDEDAKNTLFSNLPNTKTVVGDLVEDQIEDFIPKSKSICKTKQKVKITIPSLSDFNDIEDEPQTKKQKQSVKGSGLMSLLPPVRGSVTTTKSFVPAVINQKKSPKTITKSNTLVPDAVRKSKALEKTHKQTQEDNTESDDDIETPETFDDEMWKQIFSRPKAKQVVRDVEKPREEAINIAPEPEKPYDGLDNEAFKELVGRSKRPIGNIKLIDINEEEILPEKDIWMAKSLTDPEMAPKENVEDPVDPTRRKKHHITYLAQQAKANEQELQSAWAASKNNRMASRAKYGF